LISWKKYSTRVAWKLFMLGGEVFSTLSFWCFNSCSYD
jgi:hypothetical protein